MAISCPNCHIPCTGCQGAKLVQASDGATVCTKCLQNYEWTVANKKKEEPTKEDSDAKATNETYQVSAPVINSITHQYNNYNN